MNSYRDLIVWQKSIDVVEWVYKLTRKYPKEEVFGITSQMRRASISIPSNIVEGYGRRGTQEYLRFLSIAFASAAELQTQIEISVRLELVSSKETEVVSGLLEEVMKMLNGLRKSLLPKP